MNSAVVEQKNDLIESFNSQFKIHLIDSNHMLREAYKIRHEVYCRELSYENLSKEEIEQDHYDSNSLHFLVEHLKDKRYIACNRLVTIPKNSASMPFPLEVVVKGRQLDLSLTEESRGDFVEISRTCILPEYRKSSIGNINNKSFMSAVSISLISACISAALYQGNWRILSLMEARFARYLRMMGMPFDLAGESVYFKGERQPYQLSPKKIIPLMKPSTLLIFNEVYQQLKSSFSAHQLIQRR